MTANEQQQELERLRRENERLTEEVNHLKKRLRNAKDPTPIERVSMRRLVEIARQAHLTLTRQKQKIIVSFGHLKRIFRSLKEAWEFLGLREEWYQEELFPPEPKPEEKPLKLPKQASCKSCSGPIAWGQRAAGWLPFNLDGSRHRCLSRNKAQLTVNTQQLVPF